MNPPPSAARSSQDDARLIHISDGLGGIMEFLKKILMELNKLVNLVQVICIGSIRCQHFGLGQIKSPAVSLLEPLPPAATKGLLVLLSPIDRNNSVESVLAS